MNRLQLLFFIALVSGFQFFAKAQQNNTPPVELIEDKQAKRWLLYAQNNTDEEQEAFLIVQGEGFRRSADRPVIKKLPPIINQPQVAILALGAIRKVPAVIETPDGDFIGIRMKMYLSHSYDHRVVNGALGGQFVKRVAEYLEGFDVNREV